MVDSPCSSCATPSNAYKKGGKVKKGKKDSGVSHSVLCDRCSKRALNASVLVRKGNAPRRRNPGVAKRFLSQGSAFGGGLPGPLNPSSYGYAPQVAMPMGRMDFISSGESSYYYNRRRDQRDDFQPQANPSGIRADVSPSIRAVSSSSAVGTPDPGLMMARGLQGQHDAMREAFANMPQAIFQGEVPRINSANTAPSSRAMPSQPATWFNTYGSSVAAASASSADLDELYGTINGRRQGRDEGQVLNRGPPQFPVPQPGGKSAFSSASSRSSGF